MTTGGHLLRRGGAPQAERGAVALEFALVLPMLVMLLLGVTTMGLAYSHHLALTNAVREGARLGAALDTGASTTTWAESVRTRVEQTFFDTGGLTDDQVCVALVDSVGNDIGHPTAQGLSCGTTPQPPTMSSGTCAVLVWARRPERVVLGVIPTIPITIGAQSVSLYGRVTTSCPGQ